MLYSELSLNYKMSARLGCRSGRVCVECSRIETVLRSSLSQRLGDEVVHATSSTVQTRRFLTCVRACWSSLDNMIENMLTCNRPARLTTYDSRREVSCESLRVACRRLESN